MQKCVVAQKNNQLSKYVAENKVDTVIYLWMGKTNTAKNPTGWF